MALRGIYAIKVQSPSRITISTKLLEELGWSHSEGGFQCVGFFRTNGELLIAPMEMAKHESHWTSELVEQVSVDAADEPTELGLSDIPNSQVLTLPHRVIEFGASLLSNKAQLRLNITKGVGSRLGIIAGDASTVFASAWAGTLIVWSEEFFASATNQPI